jgi:hypothetical protein
MKTYKGDLGVMGVKYEADLTTDSSDSARHTLIIEGNEFEVNGFRRIGRIKLTFVGNGEFDDFLQCVEKIAKYRLLKEWGVAEDGRRVRVGSIG